MSSTPFMQLYPADYLAKTMDLTTEQHGAYLLILMTMWQHDASLPDDPAKLARIARMTPARFKAVWAEIGRFFEADGGRITNNRLSKERQKAVEKSSKRADAGRAGGHAKALKENEARLANAMREPRHLPDTRVQKEEGDAYASPCAAGPKAPSFDDFWSAWPLGKVGKDAARKAFGRLSPQQRIGATAHAAEWCGSWRAANPRLNDIHPSTYLNNKRWEDETQPTFTLIPGGSRDQSPQHISRPSASDTLRYQLDVAGRMRRPSSENCF